MVEPVGFTASIVILLVLTKQVLGYIKDAHNASNKRKKVFEEITSTQNLLRQLNQKLEEAKWGDTMKVLTTPRGPLQQLENALKDLEKRLRLSENCWKTLKKTFKWPFDKKETDSIFSSMERSKSLLTLALQQDSM